MVEFINNNVNNTSIYYISFKLNYGYYSYISFMDKIDYCLKFCLAHKLTKEMKNLILIYQLNLLYTQKIQKKALDKDVKTCNYALGKKILLNGKNIKLKQN